MIKFCRQCGQKVSYAIPSGDTLERAICSSCSYIDYENPRIITGILPIYKDEVLLCKRAIEPAKNKWTIPSGFMECNETVEEGALREAQEEAGISPKIKQLYGIYNLTRIHQVYLLYLGILPSKHYQSGIETTTIRFFHVNELPWKNIAFSAVVFVLRNYLSDYKNQKFLLRTGSE
tara:strand:+ start:230 stop:757 length:528 start_codon:yes stop_codon:yes gene_type:complete